VQFEAVYKDLQMLSELQRKLLRTRQVIESNIEITKGCRKRYMRYASLERFKFETPVFSALENQDQEFMGHGRRVQEMLDRLHSTVDLVSLSML
jgi:Mg2+ and Co2+ transporter CorA